MPTSRPRLQRFPAYSRPSTVTKTTSLMDRLSRFKIPRRWRLHRRGHPPTTAHDTPQDGTTKSDAPPIKTSSDTSSSGELESDYEGDYFGLPFFPVHEDEVEPTPKPAIEQTTVPLELLKSLENRLFCAQLNQTTIGLLKVELKDAKFETMLCEHSINLYRRELQEARDELRELRSKLETGNDLTARNVGNERLIINPASECQPLPTPPTMNNRRESEPCSSDSAPKSSCSSAWPCPYP